MRVLVACEESQAVTKEMRNLGHEAYSCDIQPCSGGHPEWHIQDDITKAIQLKILSNHNIDNQEEAEGYIFRTQDGYLNTVVGKWELIIAHPPCTYLSNVGARHLFPNGELNKKRYKKGLEAKEFFMKLYNADCPRIAVENPVPSKIYELPRYDQIIQPYEYDNPYSKRTCLRLKGLPLLKPTEVIPRENLQSTKVAGNWYNKGGKDRQKNRSKTFPGIAKAMADQWAGNNLDYK